MDKTSLPINIDIACQSVIIRNMIEDLGIEDSDENEIAPLPNVNAAILKKKILLGVTVHMTRIMIQ